MKNLKLFLAPILAFVVISTSVLPAFAKEEKGIVPDFESQKNGVFVSTDGNTDFPPKANLTKNQFEFYAQELVNKTKEMGINTIYYDAVSFGKAAYKSKIIPIKESIFYSPQAPKNYDPLEIITKKAQSQGLLVVATINPVMTNIFDESGVKHSNFTYDKASYKDALRKISEIIHELSYGYKIDGILITNIFETDFEKDTRFLKAIKDIVSTVYNSAMQAQNYISVGISASSSINTKNTSAEFLKSCSPYCDYFIFDIKDSNEKFYEAQVRYWTEFCREKEKGIFIKSNISNYKKPITISNEEIPSPKDLDAKIYINNQNEIDGTIFDSYKSLVFDLDSTAKELTAVSNNKNKYKNKLNKGKYNLEISYPSENESVTKNNIITILGTCDPSETLYINGNKIKVNNIDGFFAHTVKLEQEKNVFYVTQGSEKQKLIINYDNSEKELDGKNAFPNYNEPVFPGEMLKVEITAPRGKKINVNFQNMLYPLEEREYVENVATYVGKIPIPKLQKGQKEKNLGNLYYSISDGEKIYNIRSNGELILMNQRETNNFSGIRGKINCLKAKVYDNPYNKAEIGSLCQDTEGIINELTDEFALFSGIGYVDRKDIDIFYSEDNKKNEIINIALNSTNEKDTFAIIGTKNSGYKISINENKIIIKLINAVNLPESLAHLKSTFFDSIDVNTDENIITLIVSEKNKLLGYNVLYDDNVLIFEFIHTPKQSKNVLPLAGINILIDAAGNGGPFEPKCADGLPVGSYNLSVAYMLNHHLKALGANVCMTRTGSEAISVYDKTANSLSSNPYLIISINNNWTPTVSQKENKFKISYDTKNPYSLSLAESIKENFSQKYDANNMALEIASEKEIISTSYCPSISLSFGNLFEPNTYSLLTDSKNIHKIIYVLGNTIMNYFNKI